MLQKKKKMQSKAHLVVEKLSLVRGGKLTTKQKQRSCRGDGDLVRGSWTGRVGGCDPAPFVLFNVVPVQVVIERAIFQLISSIISNGALVQGEGGGAISYKWNEELERDLPAGSVVELASEKDQLVDVERVGRQCGVRTTTIERYDNKEVSR